MGKAKPTSPRGSDKGPSQAERFKQAARELGADESEERFKERLRKIAKAPLPRDDVPKSEEKGAGSRRRPTSDKKAKNQS